MSLNFKEIKHRAQKPVSHEIGLRKMLINKKINLFRELMLTSLFQFYKHFLFQLVLTNLTLPFSFVCGCIH